MTHSTAGLMAPAGARLADATRALGCVAGADLSAAYGVQVHPASGSHQTSTWTTGAIAKPETFLVFDGKNRPTRPSRSAPPG